MSPCEMKTNPLGMRFSMMIMSSLFWRPHPVSSPDQCV